MGSTVGSTARIPSERVYSAGEARRGTYTLVEVVSGADDRLAAAQQPTHLIRQKSSLRLLQRTCTRMMSSLFMLSQS